MNTFTVFIFLFLTCLESTSGKIYGFGRCPDIQPRRNFDIRKFSGTWYDQENYEPKLVSSSCSSMDISRIPKTSTYSVTYAGRSGFSNNMWTQNVSAEMSSPGAFEIRVSRWSPTQVSHVVATDYRTFALVHSCIDYYAIHYENVQILSRTRTPLNDKAKRRVYKLMRANELSREFLNGVDHNGCQ